MVMEHDRGGAPIGRTQDGHRFRQIAVHRADPEAERRRDLLGRAQLVRQAQAVALARAEARETRIFHKRTLGEAKRLAQPDLSVLDTTGPIEAEGPPPAKPSAGSGR